MRARGSAGARRGRVAINTKSHASEKIKNPNFGILKITSTDVFSTLIPNIAPHDVLSTLAWVKVKLMLYRGKNCFIEVT